MKDPYYSLPQVSNSDLTEIKKYWMPQDVVYDLEKAYAFGTLIDNMITEPQKINYFKLQCDGEQYTEEDFYKAGEMKKAFFKDPFCQQIAKICSFQHVTIRKGFKINYDGIEFELDMRCKWDLFSKSGISGDIKSTTATTQKGAVDAAHHFDYFRGRALYMDLEDKASDIMIFISKVNYKIFKVPTVRGSDVYKKGKEDYSDLAFKWLTYFGDLKTLKLVS